MKPNVKHKMAMSKMNKADLYKLCKELQEENKRLQFDNNCLEEDINMLKEEYDGKILYLQEHYDEWKNKNAINHLHKNYNHQEFMKGLGIVINQ